MLAACDSVTSFVQRTDRNAFLADDSCQSAVVHKLEIIGEAARGVSDAIRQDHPEVPWRLIVGFRNLAVHEYFATDWEIVWDTAVRHAPVLREQIAAILAVLPDER